MKFKNPTHITYMLAMKLSDYRSVGLKSCRTSDRIPLVSSEGGGLTGWSLYPSSPHPACSIGFSIPCKVYVIHCINDSRSFWTKLPRWNTICYLKVFSEFITKYISFYCKPSLANELLHPKNLTFLSFNVFFPFYRFMAEILPIRRKTLFNQSIHVFFSRVVGCP